MYSGIPFFFYRVAQLISITVIHRISCSPIPLTCMYTPHVKHTSAPACSGLLLNTVYHRLLVT